MTAAFDGGTITSNAGSLLLREIDRSMGLFDRMAACFRDQRITGLALGFQDLNDHDALRHDPVLALLSGKIEGEAARRWRARAR